MLQVGPVTYLMITDNILLPTPLESMRTLLILSTKGKRRGHVFKRLYTSHTVYLHTLQIGTHIRFCLQLIFHIVHLRKRGYTACIVFKRKKKRSPFVTTMYSVYNLST